MLRRDVLGLGAFGLCAAALPLRPTTAADAVGKREFDLKEKNVELNSGWKMPILGLGTYSLHGDVCVRSVRAALAFGMRIIDTASIYGNEREVGRAVREAVRNGLAREEIFVTTKLYPPQFDRPEEALEESLAKLDIGYVDLMLLHHPGSGDVAAYRAIEKAVERKLVRSIGLSNWYVKELADFLPKVDTTPALVQNEIHPFYQEQDVVPFMQEKGIVVQSWYPFGGRGWTAPILEHPEIVRIGRAHGKTAAQVILRWNLQRNVAVIPGSSNPAHIKENAEVFDFELAPDEMRRLAKLDRGEKHDWY